MEGVAKNSWSADSSRAGLAMQELAATGVPGCSLLVVTGLIFFFFFLFFLALPDALTMDGVTSSELASDAQKSESALCR